MLLDFCEKFTKKPGLAGRCRYFLMSLNFRCNFICVGDGNRGLNRKFWRLRQIRPAENRGIGFRPSFFHFRILAAQRKSFMNEAFIRNTATPVPLVF